MIRMNVTKLLILQRNMKNKEPIKIIVNAKNYLTTILNKPNKDHKHDKIRKVY